MELSDYLSNIGKEGYHWANYHIIMDKIRFYEKKYGIKIWLVVQEKVEKD